LPAAPRCMAAMSFRSLLRTIACLSWVAVVVSIGLATKPWRFGRGEGWRGSHASPFAYTCLSMTTATHAALVTVSIFASTGLAVSFWRATTPYHVIASVCLAVQVVTCAVQAAQVRYDCEGDKAEDDILVSIAYTLDDISLVCTAGITLLRVQALAHGLDLLLAMRCLRILWAAQVFCVMTKLAFRYVEFVWGHSLVVHVLNRLVFLVLILLLSVFYSISAHLFFTSFLVLRRAVCTPWGQERRVLLQSLCRLAKNQFTAVAVELLVTVFIKVVMIALFILNPVEYNATLLDWYFLGQSLHYLMNVVVTLILAGILHPTDKIEQMARSAEDARERTRARSASGYKADEDVQWQGVVEELAMHGFTLEKLLLFYKDLPNLMPHFNPELHTTTDVVRAAVIPNSAREGCAYAVKMMGGVPTRPQVMVTHSWGNLFRDLVAAIVADALEEPTFEMLANLMETDLAILQRMLSPSMLNRTYWVCAFSVNQHNAICAANFDHSKDPVTHLEHPPCVCGRPRYFNTTPPLRSDGKSIRCQMNKFDDMMSFLAATDNDFAQVIAVDRKFGLFGRAWCVAEIAEAHKMGVTHRLKVSAGHAEHSKHDQLQHLRIEHMKAARPEDVEDILAKIPDVSEFNKFLQELLFGQSGLFVMWQGLSALDQASKIGRHARLANVLGPWSCLNSSPQPAPLGCAADLRVSGDLGDA